MKRLFFCLFAAVAAVSSVIAQVVTPPTKEGAARSEVPTEEVNSLLKKVQELQAKQHYFDALQELEKAEALAPGNPIFPNVRGSLYTAMRDFGKARACFEQALKLMPGAFEPRFNLAELLYVQGKYAESEAAFSLLLKEVPRLREEVRHLTQFKVIVCRLKQNRVEEAEEAAKSFTFMDDTPAYYFAKAAASFQKSRKDEAQSWLGRARRIFKPKQNAPYFDTLMEGHWMESISVPGSKAESAAAAEGASVAPEVKP